MLGILSHMLISINCNLVYSSYTMTKINIMNMEVCMFGMFGILSMGIIGMGSLLRIGIGIGSSCLCTIGRMCPMCMLSMM